MAKKEMETPENNAQQHYGFQASIEGRLRFERLLSELSTAFIRLSGREVDNKIQYGLKKVVEFLDIDASSIAELTPDGQGYHITHYYRTPGYPTPPIRSSELVPWYTERLLKGKIFVLERLPDDLPDDVPSEHVHLMKYVKAHLAIPLKVGEYKLGMIGFSSFRKKYLWPNELIQRLRVIGEIFANALERKRAEETLKRSEEQLRLMANSLPALISYVDQNQCFQFTNNAYNIMYGLSPGEANGRSLKEVLGNRIYMPIKDYIEQALSGKEVSYETQIPCDDGSVRQIEVSYVPHIDATGKVIGIFALEHDVTDRKKAELDAQRHRDELAHVARVATLDEIAASLAHELNQPLAAIMSNAQAAQRFLNMNNPDIDEVREVLTDIINDDRRASEIIRRLRVMVKKGEHQESLFNINDIIQEIMKLIHSDANQRRISISQNLSSDLPNIFGDRIQVQQVVLNLILNGFTAMHQVEEGDKKLTISTSKSSPDMITVSVKDSGIGMDEKIMEKMFDAFFTTRPEGLGMGLSISRSILEAHAGKIWAEPNSDCGTTFHFSLPTQQENVK